MDIRNWNYIRAAGLALPLLMTGCAIVPDEGVVYSSGYRVPAYSAGYSSGYYNNYNSYHGYSSGYYPRPLAPPVYIARPAPPPAVVVWPAPLPPVYGYRDRPYGYGGYGGGRERHHGSHDRGWRGR